MSSYLDDYLAPVSHVRIRFTSDVWREDSKPGDAEYDKSHTGLTFRCPGGCGKLNGVKFIGSGAWKWDGDETAPTVTPSILHNCGWAGYLTGGVFVPC